MVVRTTKSPRVFAINPEQSSIDIGQRIKDLEIIVQDADLEKILGMVKNQRDVIETIFVEVKQKAMQEASEQPEDGNEGSPPDDERLDIIHIQNVTDAITKLSEKTGVDLEDFQNYFQTSYLLCKYSHNHLTSCLTIEKTLAKITVEQFNLALLQYIQDTYDERHVSEHKRVEQTAEENHLMFTEAFLTNAMITQKLDEHDETIRSIMEQHLKDHEGE